MSEFWSVGSKIKTALVWYPRPLAGIAIDRQLDWLVHLAWLGLPRLGHQHHQLGLSQSIDCLAPAVDLIDGPTPLGEYWQKNSPTVTVNAAMENGHVEQANYPTKWAMFIHVPQLRSP